MNYRKIINNNYKNIPDLIYRKVRYNLFYVHIYYLESLSSSDRVNNYILDNITNNYRNKGLLNILAGSNVKIVSIDEFKKYIFSGYTIIIYLNKIYAVETKAELDRAIAPPSIEQDLYGSKDALVENIQKNIGLIKRRIKSNHLKSINYEIGEYTLTTTTLLYVETIARDSLVKETAEILKNIKIDRLIDAGELKQYLVKEGKSLFPAAKLTERPDVLVNALMEGKIIIIVDNSPFGIILPAVLADFINPISDNYIYSANINFVKLLRFLCFFLTIFTPAIYIAIISFNQETIPPKLLTSFITQRQGVPFPATIEAFFMLFICEMLRESDIRFPNSYGSSISVLGALILGESAVAANIVSPIMIIIVALTFISSMVFSNVEIVNSVRVWRFTSLLVASFYGLYGVFMMFILLLVNLCSYYSAGLSYTFPVAPFDLTYLKESLLRGKITGKIKRSKYLTRDTGKAEQ